MSDTEMRLEAARLALGCSPSTHQWRALADEIYQFLANKAKDEEASK